MTKLEELAIKYEDKLKSCTSDEDAMYIMDAIVSEKSLADEFDENQLEEVAGGLIMPKCQPYDPTWLQKLAKKIAKKYIKKSHGGGGRGF